MDTLIAALIRSASSLMQGKPHFRVLNRYPVFAVIEYSCPVSVFRQIGILMIAHFKFCFFRSIVPGCGSFDVTKLDFLPHEIRQDRGVKGGLKQPMLIVPVDHCLEAHFRCVGKEDHVLF